jgi:hypothetical protein
MIKESFYKICNDSKTPESFFVSLYVKVPYYGGPEEGGWWGSDTHLEAYKQYSTLEEANFALEKVQEYAKDLNFEAKKSFGEKCSNELDWLEARGLESDYLPEVDGEEEYFVVVEKKVGSLQSKGTRVYE